MRSAFTLVSCLVCCPLASAQAPRTQVQFTGPSGMQVRWLTRAPDGKETFSEPPLEVPGRFNFRQGGVYRLKLSHIRGYAGLQLYPTLEVVAPFGLEAQQFLAHNAVKLEVSDEDLRLVTDGEHVTRTIYLPGASGPGVPLLVLRMGNKDLDAP